MNAKRYLRILYALLIGAGASLGAFFVPVYLVMPAFLAFVGVAWGGWCFIFALAASIVGPLALNGFAPETVYALSLYVPGAIAISIGLATHKPHRSSVVTASVLAALALYACLCLPSLLEGKPPFEGVAAVFDEFSEAFKEMAAAVPQQGESVSKTASYFIAELKDMLPEITTGFIVTVGMLMGLGNYMIAFALSGAAGAEVREMSRFSRWQLSRGYSLGMLILIMGALVMQLIKLNNAEAVMMAVECLILFPLALMGVCTLEFLIVRRKTGVAGRRAFAYVATAVLLPYSLFVLAAAGLTDRLFKLRRRSSGAPPVQ